MLHLQERRASAGKEEKLKKKKKRAKSSIGQGGVRIVDLDSSGFHAAPAARKEDDVEDEGECKLLAPILFTQLLKVNRAALACRRSAGGQSRRGRNCAAAGRKGNVYVYKLSACGCE